MFPSLTEAIVKKQSAGLISNKDLNLNWELLTLVRIRKKKLFSHFRPRDKYQPLAIRLSSITGEGLSLEPRAEVLVKDFHVSSCFGGGVEVGGGSTDVQVDVSGEVKHVDESSTVTLMSEHFSFQDLEELSFRSIKLEQKVLDLLQLKEGEKLAFVKQRVFNSGPVDVSREFSRSGSVGTKFLGFLTVGVKGEKADKYKFTVPENKTFAFALKELMVEDGVLTSPEILHREKVQLLIEGLRSKHKVLSPLAGRRYLLRDLRQILEDRDALTLLEDALDQIRYGEYQRPQSEAVVWFMALLDVSSASKDLIQAVHLLVSALEALPGNIPAVLAKSDPETLNRIVYMMGQLVHGQGRQLQPQLRPLQEDGELHWVTKFLCSANNLRDLEANWDDRDSPPEGVLELLYVGVRGLCLMQCNVHS